MNAVAGKGLLRWTAAVADREHASQFGTVSVPCFNTELPRRCRHGVGAAGESPGGVSPPGAPRTVLEPLGSHGSRCSAVDVQHAPVCEQSRVCAVYPSQPVSRALWSWAQTFELVPRPADQVGIYASECWMECRPVKVAVVVDPASEIRVVLLGQVSQGQVAPLMQGPSPDRLPDCFQRLRLAAGRNATAC